MGMNLIYETEFIKESVAAMRHVTIPDGQEPDGAVAALVEAVKAINEWIAVDAGETLRVEPPWYADMYAALARFEVVTRGDGEEGA